MRRLTAVILTITVVAIVVVAYWSLVGFSEAVDDFNDPESEDTTPTAYATFSASGAFGVDNYVPDATIAVFRVSVRDYISPDEGRVYETRFLELFTWPGMEVVAYLEFSVTVVGGGDKEVWTSAPWPLLGTGGDAGGDWSVDTGRCYLTDECTASATLTITGIPVDGSGDTVLATKTITFEVNV